MNIAFIDGPWPGNGYRTQRWVHLEPMGNINPPPLFMMSAAACCRQQNHTVKLWDAPAQKMSDEVLINELHNFNPEIVVVNTTTPSFNYDVLIIDKIKKALPDVKVIAIGPHVTVLYESVLNTYKNIDIIAVGEYDYTIADIANHLPSLDEVKGIAYRSNGKISIKTRELISNLDDLPCLPYDLVDIYAYREHSFPATRKPYATISMSRGCDCLCNFCLWPQVLFHGRVRFRSPERIIDDILWLKSKFGVRFIYFEDDYINLSWNKLELLCELLIRKNVKMPWGCLGRTEGITKERLNLMKKSGLYLIKYGLETASKDLLNKMEKDCNLDEFAKAVYLTKKAGVMVHITTMVGMIGDSIESLNTTLKYIKKIVPDSAQFAICTPYPGTKLYKECQEKGILDYKTWNDFDGSTGGVIRLEYFTKKELLESCNYAYLSYYKSLSCIMLRLKRMMFGPFIISQWIRSMALVKRLLMKVFYRK